MVGDRTIDVPIRALVRCVDGEAGISESVIIDPKTEVLTHVVVHQRWPSHHRRLVPTTMIASATETRIDLNITLDELHRLDSFIGTETMPSEQERRYEAFPGAFSPGVIVTNTTELQPRYIRVENVPEGEIKIDAHAEVDATDGRVGRVEGFAVTGDEHASSLVVRTTDLPPREFMVPASAIAGIEDERVKLDMDRAAVQALPHVRPLKGFDAPSPSTSD